MLKQLVLTVLCVAISTTAYAGGWILWEESLYDNRQTSFNPSQNAHGFPTFNECRIIANERLSQIKQREEEEKRDYMLVKDGYDPRFRSLLEVTKGITKQYDFRNYCYPSDFDPRKKASQ